MFVIYLFFYNLGFLILKKISKNKFINILCRLEKYLIDI